MTDSLDADLLAVAKAADACGLTGLAEDARCAMKGNRRKKEASNE